MDINKQPSDELLQTIDTNEEKSTINEEQSGNTNFNEKNKNHRRIALVILAIIMIISCIIPIKGCVHKNELANAAYRDALAAKEDGDYISAYSECNYALSIRPHMRKAQKLKEELEPLKKSRKQKKKQRDKPKKKLNDKK